jgi:hypothetical protein
MNFIVSGHFPANDHGANGAISGLLLALLILLGILLALLVACITVFAIRRRRTSEETEFGFPCEPECGEWDLLGGEGFMMEDDFGSDPFNSNPLSVSGSEEETMRRR